MGRRFRRTGKEMANRWHEKMPRFFYWLIVVACGIGGGSAAINQLVPMTGGVLHEWWIDLYPYVFGTCVGVVFACKFTVAGGYKDINPDRMTRGNMVLNKDIEHMSGEQPGDPTPDEIPDDGDVELNEIDPYDDSPDA